MKKKMDFSKKLAISVSILFFITVLFSLVVWLLQSRVPTEILEIVASPFSVVISGYFLKAGVENFQKIKNGNEESET